MDYAILDKDGIVKGISQLSGEVSDSNMILLESFDMTIMGKKYDKGKFVDSGIVKPVYVDPVIAKLDEIIALLKK